MAASRKHVPGGELVGQRWWSRAQSRVLMLAGVLGVVALVGVVVSATWPRDLFDVTWFVALVALFTATEGFAVHVRVRRGAHAVSLADVPMVLGMLAVHPGLVIVARLIGGGGGLLLIRRQRGLKFGFNVALIGVQAVVATATFRLCAAVPGQLGVREWLASYAATLLADVAAVVAVTAVIALHDDPGEWRRLPAAMRSVPLSAVATTAALVSAQAARGNPWVFGLLALLSVAVHVAHRAFVQQRQGKEEVEQLYAFTRAINGAAEMNDVLPVVLDQVRDQLRAGLAELVVDEAPEVVRYRGDGAGGTTVIRGELSDGDRWLEAALRGRPTLHEPDGPDNAMAVPVSIGDRAAVLAVAKSLPDSGEFSEARLHLLEALANHAGIALMKASLVERLKREVSEKEYLALYDPLSGLPNRRHFHTLTDGLLRDPGTAATTRAVFVLDLDRFKEVNDALGHETGDALLVEIAGRLHGYVADRGVVGRMGGDEFAVTLPTAGSAVDRAAELAALIERPISLGPLTLHVRASIGVACAPAHGTDAQALVRHADVAMYAAKQRHTGVAVYDQTADSNTPQRLARIADLRHAVEGGHLLVAFQPKVDPRSGAVTGAEALVRWCHPLDGLISPEEFIPLAEHSGLIRPLTAQVLETALRHRAEWERDGHQLGVAVNLSPNSLSDEGLVGLVSRLLEQTDTRPSSLTLEITEGTVMTDPASSLATLGELHALGVKLSIDDFGTGYSSLSRLRRLPIDEVKIDRSFVQRLAHDERDRALVRSALQMGHALELSVVAEGVEDAETMDYLAGIGCDTVQGFHLSRPLFPDDFAAWLSRHDHAAPVPAASGN